MCPRWRRALPRWPGRTSGGTPGADAGSPPAPGQAARSGRGAAADTRGSPTGPRSLGSVAPADAPACLTTLAPPLPPADSASPAPPARSVDTGQPRVPILSAQAPPFGSTLPQRGHSSCDVVRTFYLLPNRGLDRLTKALLSCLHNCIATSAANRTSTPRSGACPSVEGRREPE